MLKSIKTFFLGVFLVAPIVLLILYALNTARKEAPKANVNVSNLKLVTPVAIIDEITQRIEEGDLEDAITKINTELPDADIPSSKGTPLLVLAAAKNYTDLLAALIQKGANPDKADLNTSETALIKAVKNQNFDAISILLNAGANPNLGTNQGLTPLGLAISLKNENIATHLLSSGATNGISKENLLLYAFRKNPVGVSIMLSGGIGPDATDKDNNTPLIISAANGDLDSAKLLVSYRANVNAKNKSGMTPLLYAVKGKYWDVAEYLINSGANINSSNIYGQNALFWAAYHGNAKMVHDLLVRGANYQKKTRLGQTALQIAQAFGHKEAAKMLEDFIAYKNLPRDSKGNIILPKVNQQNTANTTTVPSQNTNTNDYINNNIISEIESNTVSATSVTQQVGAQTNTKQNPIIISNQNIAQPAKTQINTLQSSSSQTEIPLPPGMDMNSISNMIPAGVLPEGMDLNSLSSISPEQLKKMGVPEDQIANITKMQQQTGQQGEVSASSNLKPKDLSNTTNTTYQNGVIKTQINKLQTSGK